MNESLIWLIVGFVLGFVLSYVMSFVMYLVIRRRMRYLQKMGKYNGLD